MHAPTRILLVDDHAVVRTGFKTLLENQADLRVVCEADCGEQACRQFVDHAPDVVIMDLSLPGIGGLEATRRLLALDPGLRVIGLSMYVSGPFPRQFLRLGGAGYVSKNADTAELVAAIRKVHAGESYISADVARNIAVSGVLGARRNGIDALSRREVQVLQQIANGLSPEEIAAAVLYLASPEAGYVTGTTLHVNGGMAML